MGSPRPMRLISPNSSTLRPGRSAVNKLPLLMAASFSVYFKALKMNVPAGSVVNCTGGDPAICG